LHRQLAEAVGFELRTKVFWRKSPNLRSRSWAFLEHALEGAFEVDDLEEFLVFQKPGPEVTQNRTMSQSELRMVSEPVWAFPAMGGARSHPYQSPAKAMRRFIELLTNPGELVVDPFAGRATTLWCAVKLGRQAVGWEREKSHFLEAKRKMGGVIKP
jgi:DNA modification methylase